MDVKDKFMKLLDENYNKLITVSSLTKFPHNKRILTEIINNRYLISLEMIDAMIGIASKEQCETLLATAKKSHELAMKNIENGGRFVRHVDP